MSRGSAAKSSSVRTSRSAGHFRVPMRRASFSEVMLLIEDMARPCKERDAILQHVASWGDRFPISLAQPKRTASVKVRGGLLHGTEVRVNDDFGLTRRCDSLGAPNHLGDAEW